MKFLPTLIPANHFGIADIHLTSSNVLEADYAAWLVGTAYVIGNRVTIISPSAAVTMTIASPCVVTWTAHGLPDGTPVRFTTTGAFPTGIVSGRIYFIRVLGVNTFSLAEKPNGEVISTSGAQSGTHTGFSTRHDVYESQTSNTGKPPALNPSDWLRVDSTNRWRMHDNSMGSQTANSNSIANVYEALQIVDAVALMNISAATVRVTVTDAVDGLIFDKTVSGIAPISASSFYAWAFEPIVRVTDILITNLPPYINADIAVTLTDTGNTVLCGNLVLGKIRDLGGTQYGMGMRIDDFSVKDQNQFGIFTVIEGAYSRRLDSTVYVDNGAVDAVFNLLAAHRAIPAVFVGAGEIGSSILFGYAASYNIVVEFFSTSLMKIEVEGLI